MKRTGNLLLLTAALAILMGHAFAQTASVKKLSEDRASANLAQEIHHQILVLPFYSVFDFITFTLDGSKVTLKGYVLRHTLKDHAEAAVKSIEGVDTVIDQIEILPALASDDDLRRAIYRTLYEDSTLAHYAVQNVPPLHIIVKNGSVSLEGYADSLADKNLAASLASSTANVHSLKNNLVVHAREGAAQ
jgi:hyperosmotically inducible periplasmic protein